MPPKDCKAVVQDIFHVFAKCFSDYVIPKMEELKKNSPVGDQINLEIFSDDKLAKEGMSEKIEIDENGNLMMYP